MEQYFEQVITAVISISVGGVIGFLVGLLKRLTKQERARVAIEKALARDYIKDAYQKYVVEGHKMTIAAYDELMEVYEAYVALGGNGTAKALMAELIKLKPYLVID